MPRHQWYIDEQDAFFTSCRAQKKVSLSHSESASEKELSACVEERLNGFDIVRRIVENERKENYVAADVVYKPVSKIDQIVNCYFTSSMRNAYQLQLAI